MKLIALMVAVLSCLTQNAFAQYAGNVEYKIGSPSDIQINGVDYTHFQLDPVTPREKVIFWGNVLDATAATVGVFTVNPQQDKVRHALAGYVVGNVTTGTMQLLLPKNTPNRRLFAALTGVGASMLVGIGKELWDKAGHGTPSADDAMATIAGGLGGSITLSFTDISNFFGKRPLELADDND